MVNSNQFISNYFQIQNSELFRAIFEIKMVNLNQFVSSYLKKNRTVNYLK